MAIMSERSLLILGPGVASLLTWFFGPAASVAMGMIVLVGLTAYIPAARIGAPRYRPVLVALAAFLIWLVLFWTVMLVANLFRDGLAQGASAIMGLGWDAATFLLMLSLFLIIGLIAGVVQFIVLRHANVPTTARYSFTGLIAGFAVLGSGYIWNQEAGNSLTVMMPALLCGLPALALLPKRRVQRSSRFPLRAMLMGEQVSTATAAAVAALIATLVSWLAFSRAEMVLAELNPFGPYGTAPLSMAVVWFMVFMTCMGAAHVVKAVGIREARLSAAAANPRQPQNSSLGTDGWSISAVAVFLGCVAGIVIAAVIAVIGLLGFEISGLLPQYAFVALLSALVITARSRIGAMLDVVVMGLVAWGLYGLYVALTLDPVNRWIREVIIRLVPG